MSYAILEIVCGMPVPDLLRQHIGFVNFGSFKDFGLETRYSGGGVTPAFAGVSLCETDEASEALASELRLKPTKAEVESAKKAMAKVRAAVQRTFDWEDANLSEADLTPKKDRLALLACIPKRPVVFLLWSSS